MTITTLPDGVKTDARLVGQFESGSPEWHELRATGIGGSEVGAICGLSPYESPFAWWAKKTGRMEPNFSPSSREIMDWGHRLEPVILDRFEEEHPELIVHRNVGTYAHPERDWQLANPDAIAVHRETGEHFIVEVKTSQYEDNWKSHDGGDTVPAHYEAQVFWYLQTLGYRRAYVVALFHGNRYNEFRVEGNEFAMDANLAQVEKLRHLALEDVQPDYDGALSTYEAVRAIHPDIEDDEVELGYLGEQYFTAKKRFDEAEAELNLIKSHIMGGMGKAKRGLVNDVWTFSRQARGNGAPFLVVKRG